MAGLAIQQKSDLPNEAPLTLDPAVVDVDDKAVRRQLAKRRHMAGDVLVELLRTADADVRESVAKRLVMLNEAPRTILVILAKDGIKIARHVLENSKSLTDSDLIQISRKVSSEHRAVIAKRREVSDAVVDAMVEFLDEDVVETPHQPYVALLVKRDELRPSHGLTMFWWATTANRKKILHRFAVTRNVLQESCSDLFPKAAADGWSDAGVRKALARVMETYDVISTDKAQTVLRYWNWSLTASLNADVLRYIKNGVIPREEEFGAAAITAALVFSHRG